MNTIIHTQKIGHIFQSPEPLKLDSGRMLHGLSVAYQTYGRLNAQKTNAILICHALTGDQFVADTHPITGKPGWWSHLVGPGKPVDTERYFVICTNVIGGCMGSSSPASLNPETGAPWGLTFPVITIHDMVRAQCALIDNLGIDRLFAVIGGSMGGMQVLSWAAHYPTRMGAAMPIATAALHTAQNIAFHEVGRQAIMADPAWLGGDYDVDAGPRNGLAVARMAAHITYLSEDALQRKFGRDLQNKETLGFSFDADFKIESYLRYQGHAFVDRFDANSYLYITRAVDYFDLAAGFGGNLANAFKNTPVKFCAISFSSDWLYPPASTRNFVDALNAAGAEVSYVNIVSDKGHDAFLLDEPEFFRVAQGFLDDCALEAGLIDACSLPHQIQENGRADIRVDLQVIGDMVDNGSRVLDIGCGDGTLLSYLETQHNVRGYGLELSVSGVQDSVARGLAVIQGDADTDLKNYADNSFDFAILSQTLQAMENPLHVLEQLLRISRRTIVSFPNFGHWRIRADLLLNGRMPVNKTIPFSWYETPNIHFCTIKDFESLCASHGFIIEKRVILNSRGAPAKGMCATMFGNMLGKQAVYTLRKANTHIS